MGTMAGRESGRVALGFGPGHRKYGARASQIRHLYTLQQKAIQVGWVESHEELTLTAAWRMNGCLVGGPTVPSTPGRRPCWSAAHPLSSVRFGPCTRAGMLS